MVKYFIKSSNPVSHYLEIEAHFTLFEKKEVEIIIPSWRPGRYESADYVKNIRNFRVENGAGKFLEHEKTSKNTWRATVASFVVKYEYFAFQCDAGASYIDDELWLLNPNNFLVYNEINIHEPCELSIEYPSGFKIATTLLQGGKIFKAKNYHELVDKPVLLSKKLSIHSYTFQSTIFEIAVSGESPVDLKSLLPQFKAFSKSQVEFFNGAFPFEKYIFLLVVLPFRFYHGVEHADNTVLVLGIDSGTDKQKFIDDLLGVASHELFHVWNIKRIRPKELQPYNFKKDTLFKTGIIAEGVTTYYGDLFLSRSGVWSPERYLEELNVFLKRHFRNIGSYHTSIITSSENLWIDGYKQGAPFHKVSIYVKGALIALMLDLTIRKYSGAKHSLDDVMRWMDREFSVKGYSLEDIKNKAEGLLGINLDNFFNKYIYGVENITPELQLLCVDFGMILEKIESDNLLERYFGIATSIKDEYLVVEFLDKGCPPEQQVSIGDQITTINGKKPLTFLHENIETPQLKLDLIRLGRHISIEVNRDNNIYMSNYAIKINPTASDEQVKMRNSWLSN